MIKYIIETINYDLINDSLNCCYDKIVHIEDYHDFSYLGFAIQIITGSLVAVLFALRRYCSTIIYHVKRSISGKRNWLKNLHHNSNQKNRFAILDRDGTIIVEKKEYITTPDEITFFPEALEGMRKIQKAESTKTSPLLGAPWVNILLIIVFIP